MPNQVPQVILPDFDVALLDRANAALQRAQLCVISNDADYEACAQEMKGDVAGQRMSESLLKTTTGPLLNALKEIRESLAPPGEIYGKAKAIRARIMGEYHTKKLAEQRRIQMQADMEAAKQRKALELRAQKADDSGNADKAIALAQQAAVTVAPVIRTDAPKIAGQSVREVWLFQIEDASLIPREYLAPDESKIRRFVNAMKADAKVPGVRIYSEKRVASGV